MALQSRLFRGNARLEQCLISHPAHVKMGDIGAHVRDIQIALELIDGLAISEAEKLAQRYGPSTAAAVLAYKKKRKIINSGYQQSEDNIVGKMTIDRLDKDMLNRQTMPKPPRRTPCPHGGGIPVPTVQDELPSPQSLELAFDQAWRQNAIV
jgi:hypothetical protein